MRGGIHIGTSGWSYKHWKGIYYPASVPSTRWLPYYAQTFGTTEINASFYRLPSEKTIEKWMQQVPPGFIFCPKMSRFLTHMKKLRDPEEPLERFFGIFAPMEKLMGPVLIQLPPQLGFNFGVADHFYALLRKRYGKFAFVVEVRHPSWLTDESLELMNGYDIGLVISHSEIAFPYLEVVTATHVYLRFHGPAALYASSYTDEFLWMFAEKCNSWEAEGHTVWAFFNNDIGGHAVVNAKRLMEMIEKK